MMRHRSVISAVKSVCFLAANRHGHGNFFVRQPCIARCLSWKAPISRQQQHTSASSAIEFEEDHETPKDDQHGQGSLLKQIENIKVSESADVTKTPAAEILENLSPEQQKILKILKLEYDVWHSLGNPVPENVTDDDWVVLLNDCRSPSSRKKYYKYLRRKESARRSEQQKKESKRIARESDEVAKSEEVGADRYKNTFFFMIRDSTINHHYYNNLAHAMLFGPHLVYDLSFESYQSRVALFQLCKQLSMSYAYNKKRKEPFALTFTGVDPDGEIVKTLTKFIPNIDEVPMSVTPQHYLDLFPAKNLVYLSPNADQTLSHYDANDVYIIGGIVDKGTEEPLTLAKAKRENIRFAKFPLDRYIQWGNGGKSLTLDQVTKIMVTLKDTNDWRKALNHVPIRKVAQRYY